MLLSVPNRDNAIKNTHIDRSIGADGRGRIAVVPMLTGPGKDLEGSRSCLKIESGEVPRHDVIRGVLKSGIEIDEAVTDGEFGCRGRAFLYVLPYLYTAHTLLVYIDADHPRVEARIWIER